MPLTVYAPKDLERYRKSRSSVPFSPDIEPGMYVFVQDADGKVWVAPDGCHVHLTVLGGARPAVAAGEIAIEDGGFVREINNLSGTFLCHPDCLLTAVGGLIVQGAKIDSSTVSPFEA